MEMLIVLGILAMTLAMVTAKRMPALITFFPAQSILLFFATLLAAKKEHSAELYVVGRPAILH